MTIMFLNRKMQQAALVFASMLLLFSLSYADVVELKNGESHEGKIVKEDDKKIILYHPHHGYKIIDKSEVLKVTRKAVTQPDKNEKPADASQNKNNGSTGLSKPGSDVQAKFKELMAKLKAEKPISLQELEKGLVELGPPVLPSLVDYVNKRANKAMIEVMLNAAVRLKDEKLLDYLGKLLDSPRKNVRLGALKALGSIGNVRSLSMLLKFLADKDGDIDLAAGESVSLILKRSPESPKLYELIRNTIASAQVPLKKRIANCLGKSGSRQAAAILLEYLGDWDAGVKITAVVALGQLGFCEQSICSAVKALLKDENLQVRKNTVLALGKLQDLEAAVDLIAFLDDRNKGIRSNAHWALRNITGLRFPANRARWKIWWDRESGKAKENRDTLMSQLRSGTRKQMIEAIKELSGIRLGRKEISKAILEFLESGDAEIRQEACIALGALKARGAVRRLIKCLDDNNPAVREKAHRALVEITGKDLPLDINAWKEHSNR